MELLDLDTTEIRLDQLECGSDHDLNESFRSYLKDLSPSRLDGDQNEMERNTYAALLREVANHLENNSEDIEGNISDGYEQNASGSDYEEEDADYPDDYEEQSALQGSEMADDGDDMFDEFEEELSQSKISRAMSREADVADNVRLEASHEHYPSEDEENYDVDDEKEFAQIIAAHTGCIASLSKGGSAIEQSYVDCDEDDDESEIEFNAPPVISKTAPCGAHLHAGYGIAASGAVAGNIGGTGLFSPSMLKEMLSPDDNNNDDEYEEVEAIQQRSHSRSKTIDRSMFNSDNPPDSREEVVYSANSYGEDGYGDAGANPVFTYKDFEFLPADDEDHELRKHKEVKRKQHRQVKVGPRAGRKIVINQGPSAPPKVTKAGPYAQEKLGAPPGVQRKKKGQPMDPAQARKHKENRERHKMMLEMIALKRKEQEDEAIRQVLREEAKRKRFKEALLEKALAKRADGNCRDDDNRTPSEPGSGKKESSASDQERDGSAGLVRRLHTRPVDANHSPDDPPRVKASLLEPTKAFEAQMMPSRRRNEDVVNEEEKAQREEENYEKVANLRRKFKEQHKQILLNILIKKREADQKKAEEEKLEAHRAMIKKMKRDERLAQKAAEAKNSATGDACRKHEQVEQAIPILKEPRKRPLRGEAPSFVTASAPDDNAGTFGATFGSTGACTPLMRSRSQGSSKDDLTANKPTTETLLKQPQRSRQAGDSEVSGSEARRVRSAALPKDDNIVAGDSKPAVIRRVRSKTEFNNPGTSSQQYPVASSGQAENGDLQRNLQALDEMAEESIAKKKEKRAAALSAKAKIDAQLEAIANQRKQAAEEEKKNEERMRRRVEKLAKRIVQGAQSIIKKDDSEEHAPADVLEQLKTRSKKVTPEMADAMVARLQAKAQKTADGIASMSTASVPARDFADWKRKHSVPPDGQVFSMTGWYPCVKEALLKRGWVFNPDPLSPFFDLKWTLRSSDIGLESLQSWQLTNHFLKNIAITTKAGLIKSLQQLVWQSDVPPGDIIPRAYDLTSISELHAFVTDFRLQKAEGLLKGVYAKIIGHNGKLTRPDRPRSGVSDTSDDGKEESVDRVTDPDGSQSGARVSAGDPARCPDEPRPFTARVLYETTVPLPDCKGKSPNDLLVNKAVFEACCSVLERHLRPEDDSYIDTNEEDDDEIPMTPLEWELISGYDMYRANQAGLPDTPPEMLGPFGREIVPEDSAADDPGKAQAVLHRNKRKQRKIDDILRSQATVAVTETISLGQKGFQRIHDILYRLQALSTNQSGLNGSGEESKNIWIVKPAAKSRGRGITTFVDLEKLLQYCDVAQKGQGSGSGGATMWIVQKYMENPMIIQNRKFDIRQWVLVTDWNPLTIYFFDEAYCRFSSEEYTTSEDSLDNSYVHLVNQSVNKNNISKKGLVFHAENGEEVNGFMWDTEAFKKYLAFRNDGADIWTEKMQPRMKEIAKMTLGCAVDMIEHRKNSWELYGFDFMVDDEYNPWLIEVNSSPACDYSTPTTERYVQKALVELLSVTLDMRKWEATPRKERGEKPDTGGWECIYKGPLLETPAAAFGTDMAVKGAGIKVLRRAQPSSRITSMIPLSNGLERDGLLYSNCDSSLQQTITKGSVNSKAQVSRRQNSGVENAPNLAHRPCKKNDDNGSDDDEAVEALKLTVKPGQSTKTAYDPSSLARFGSSHNPTRVPLEQNSGGLVDFNDDISGDEEDASSHQIASTKLKIKRQGSNPIKKVSAGEPVASIPVPVKLFTVEF